MKLFFGEFKPDYEKYHFPYQVWLLREDKDRVDEIYKTGFLPIRSLPGIYYLSRSVRVNLRVFELSSENRRILKKTENIVSKIVPLSEFNYSPEIQKLCHDYCETRLGRRVLPTPAIRSIFKGGVYNQIMVFKDKSRKQDVGYAVCFVSENILHYAYAFYDLDYLSQSLGARMILEAVCWAKENNKNYAYLGTCYEEKALYKTEFKGVEFFNGFEWSDNLRELKVLVEGFEGDESYRGEYLLRNKKYLVGFHGDLHDLLNKKGVRVNF